MCLCWKGAGIRAQNAMSKKDKNTSIVRSASSLYIGPQSETLSDQSERRIDLHIKSAVRLPTAPQRPESLLYLLHAYTLPSYRCIRRFIHANVIQCPIAPITTPLCDL